MLLKNKKILLKEVMEDYLNNNSPHLDVSKAVSLNFSSGNFPIQVQKKIDWDVKEISGGEYYQKTFDFNTNEQIAKFVYLLLGKKDKFSIGLFIKKDKVTVRIELSPLYSNKKIVKFVDSTYDSIKSSSKVESTDEQ